MVDAGVSRTVPALAVHRIGAQFLFDDHELQPYWGLVNAYEPDHEDTLGAFDAIGDTWEIFSSSHWSGKIADPQGRFDNGLNEYKYQIVSQDEVGDRDLTLTLRPGYPDATHVDTGDQIGGIPKDIPESIRVQVESTNIDFPDILPLIRSWANHIGLNPSYFETLHEWSRIYEMEAYLRIDRHTAENNITGEGAIIQEVAQFGSTEGYKGEYKWDHEEIQGHREAVALDPSSWEMLMPEQQFEKRMKCYHPKHPRSEVDDKDPLAHPKLEFQLWAGFDNESVPVDQYHSLYSDMQQAAGNILHWSGISLDANSEVFVEDQYYQPKESEQEVKVYSNPMDELKHSIAQSAEDELVRPDITEAEFDVVRAVADGGSSHYHEVAEIADVSSSTVYRALKKLDILDTDNGVLRFADSIVRSKVSDVIDRFKQSKNHLETSLQDITQDTNILSNSDDPTALERWMCSHGAVLRNSTGELHFEFPDHQFSEREMVEILRSGFEAAQKSGLESAMRDALISFETRAGDVRSGWQAFISRGRGLFALGQQPVRNPMA